MQNINLFTNFPPRSKDYFGAEWLTLGLIAVITILLIFYGAGYIPLIKQKESLAQLVLERENLQNQITALEKLMAKKSTEYTPLVLPKISPYLIGLANTVPDGLWLKTIKISTEDGSLNLNGNALSFFLISTFIKNLIDQKAFPLTNLTSVTLIKPEKSEDSGTISFHLSREAVSIASIPTPNTIPNAAPSTDPNSTPNPEGKHE